MKEMLAMARMLDAYGIDRFIDYVRIKHAHILKVSMDEIVINYLGEERVFKLDINNRWFYEE